MKERCVVAGFGVFAYVALLLTTSPYWVEATGIGLGVRSNMSESDGLTPEALPSPIPTTAAGAGPGMAVSEREVLKGNVDRPFVALTFDADSSPKPLDTILTTLRTKGISATFFIQGSWAESFPEATMAIVRDGHEIGNHSYSHPDFRELTEEQMVEELSLTEDALLRVTGVSSKPLFRPPYSYRNETVRRVAAEQGYLTVVWTHDAFDWKRDATEETIHAEIVGHAEPGAIYVQHVGDTNSANVLGRVIDDLRAQGLEPVTLSALLSQ